MTRALRPHQTQAYDAVRAEWADGVTRTAVVHATGLGKGDLIGKMAADEAEAGGHALVLAHRDEILAQIGDRVRAYAPRVRVGRVQGELTQRGCPVTAASVQTVGTRLRAAARGDRRAAARLPRPPSLILVDECHRAVSDTYLETLRHYGAFDGTRACGFTATLVRGDRRGLGDVWESVAHTRDIAWAVDAGLLVRPVGRVVVAEHMDLARAKVSRGDYQDGDLGAMVSQDVDQIVKAWHEHAADRITIAFAPTVDSAAVLAEEFERTGIRAEVVTGTTPGPERRRIYARLARGITRVLVNVCVLVEGWDCPPVSCVLMARPTRLPGVYQQAVGRGLRPAPDKGDCLVLDVVGASRTQRLVTLVDLSPSSAYDTSALDALPCDRCGLPVRGNEGEDLCVCPPEEGERDPDGGRLRLVGPARYEDLDLLLERSPSLWLSTYGGTPILPAGKRIALLWRDPDTDLFSAGHMNARGRREGVWLAEGVGLEEAQALAERWAHATDPALSSRGASWRKGGAPSPAQVDLASSLGIDGAAGYTKARLSDEITVALASRRID